jgi:hypothetical protein
MSNSWFSRDRILPEMVFLNWRQLEQLEHKHRRGHERHPVAEMDGTYLARSTYFFNFFPSLQALPASSPTLQ